METLTSQALNDKLDILGTDDMFNACKIVVYSLGGSRARKRMRLCKVPARLCLVQMSPVHLLHIISNIVVDASLF